MKPISVIFSRERVVGAEKIALGFQAEIESGETPEQALENLQSFVETKLSALAPSQEELDKRQKKTEAEAETRRLYDEFEARKAEIVAKYGDVLEAPLADNTSSVEATVAQETPPGDVE